MQKLTEQTEKNSPEAYDEIFRLRQQKGVDEFDQRRWQHLLKYYRGGKLVDLGTLDSLVPIMAKKLHPRSQVWGLDLAAEAITAMQQKFPKIFYHVGDVYNTKFPVGYFRYVVAGEIMEHLENPEKFLIECNRILQRGGILAISVPYNEAIEPGAVDGERHLYSYVEQDFKELLKNFSKVEFEILHSRQNPYKYCFPQLLVFAKKK